MEGHDCAISVATQRIVVVVNRLCRIPRLDQAGNRVRRLTGLGVVVGEDPDRSLPLAP